MKQKSKTDKKSKWERSSSYRQMFLKENRGLFGSWYICSYCFKPIHRSKMEVDHHIAINFVKTNPLYKLWFGVNNLIRNTLNKIFHKQSKKMSGVNVAYNLIPACSKCNGAKSDKGGIWILRGAIGGSVWRLLNGIDKFFVGTKDKPARAGLVFILLGISVLAFATFGLPALTTFISSLASTLTTLFGTISGIFLGIFS